LTWTRMHCFIKAALNSRSGALPTHIKLRLTVS